MTWLSTWPSNGKPAYKEHATEHAAEAHAKWLVDSNTATTATAFEMPNEETA